MKLIDNINSTLGIDIGKNLNNQSKLKIAASYFSIYAYAALKQELEKVTYDFVDLPEIES